MPRCGLNAERESQWRDLMAAPRRAVDDVLTARQRRVSVAVGSTATPGDVLMHELGTTRNAIYKSPPRRSPQATSRARPGTLTA